MGSSLSSPIQVNSLPQGGALHGIGVNFSPHLQNGTGNITVPIALPTGRNGFQPQLNRVYSTGYSNEADETPYRGKVISTVNSM